MAPVIPSVMASPVTPVMDMVPVLVRKRVGCRSRWRR